MTLTMMIIYVILGILIIYQIAKMIQLNAFHEYMMWLIDENYTEFDTKASYNKFASSFPWDYDFESMVVWTN